MNRMIRRRPYVKTASLCNAIAHTACFVIASACPVYAQPPVASLLLHQDTINSSVTLNTLTVQSRTRSTVSINENGELSVTSSMFALQVGYSLERKDDESRLTPQLKETSQAWSKGPYVRLTMAF